MTQHVTCQNCGAELSDAAAEGLCPKCVLRDGLEFHDATLSLNISDPIEGEGSEIGKYKLLEKIGNSVYGEQDPSEVLYLDKPFEGVENEKGYFFKTRLPFVEEKEIELKKFGDELVIDLGNRRKSVMLPRFASFLKLDDYRFKAPWLVVSLVK